MNNVDGISGHLTSDGIMWYLMPFKHWRASSTHSMYFLGSVYLFSEILESSTGVSSKFVCLILFFITGGVKFIPNRIVYCHIWFIVNMLPVENRLKEVFVRGLGKKSACKKHK